jgi:hypothetical protein
MVALWLTSVAAAHASPTPPSFGARLKHTLSGRGQGDRVRSSRHRSLHTLIRTYLTVRRHVLPHLQRRPARPFHGDQTEAIQNAGAALGGEAGQRRLIALEPMGMLAVRHCQRPPLPIATRRSPRGPPAVA